MVATELLTCCSWTPVTIRLGWPKERSRYPACSIERHNRSLQSRGNWDKIIGTCEVTH